MYLVHTAAKNPMDLKEVSCMQYTQLSKCKIYLPTWLRYYSYLMLLFLTTHGISKQINIVSVNGFVN